MPSLGLSIKSDQKLNGVAPLLVLSVKSSCWNGSHLELGNCGLSHSCERRASEPSPYLDEVHGSRRQHVLQMRFGRTDIAASAAGAEPGRPPKLLPRCRRAVGTLLRRQAAPRAGEPPPASHVPRVAIA
jgi:hypothetical protein